MIPVSLAPEPLFFDKKVRKKGHTWLRKHGIPRRGVVPKEKELPAYWRKFSKELWSVYSGICAYYAIYFEFVTGASSTDHFIAKSKRAGMAYEWTNYRLACIDANRNKNMYNDVLDPVGLAPQTFFINFADGSIFPNPKLLGSKKNMAEKTIDRLKLNSNEMKKLRTKHFSQYRKGLYTAVFLQKQSPFVYLEMERQGLL